MTSLDKIPEQTALFDSYLAAIYCNQYTQASTLVKKMDPKVFEKARKYLQEKPRNASINPSNIQKITVENIKQNQNSLIDNPVLQLFVVGSFIFSTFWFTFGKK